MSAFETIVKLDIILSSFLVISGIFYIMILIMRYCVLLNIWTANMYTFISSEVRELSSPLTNLGGKYFAFKICQSEKLLWFVQHWSNNIPAYIKCFDNDREFNIYWKNLKRHYKNEKQHKQQCCPDLQLYENPFYPF